MNQDSPAVPQFQGGHRQARRPILGYLWAGLSVLLLAAASGMAGYALGSTGDMASRVPLSIATFIALAAGAVSALSAYRVFASPVKLVAEFLSTLAEGNGDLSVRIPHGAPLPVRTLANGANEFIRCLNEDLHELRTATTKFSVFSQDIASSSDKLSASSEIQVHEMIDVARTLDRFNDTLQAIKSQIETQVTNIDETSDAIDALTRGMGSIVETSKSIQSQVGGTVSSVEESHERIAGSLEQSTEMDAVVSSLAQKMDNLARRSDQITQIVQVIQDISERTHVLATNASIQAAKAGDAGRGFAVVAGQVRELSNRTGASVSEIDQLMRDTVGSIREAMSETKRVESFTRDFRKSATDSHHALQAITSDIESIDRKVALITGEVTNQERATNQVRINAESLLQFSETVKREISEQATRSDQIISVINLARDNSENYAQASKTLSQLGKYLTVGVDQLRRVLARYVLDSTEVVVSYNRSAPRVRNVYSLEVVDQSLQHEIGYLDDLSLTGLKMLTKRSLQSGQFLDIAILPSKTSGPDQKPCALRVEVRWVEEEPRGAYRAAGCRIVEATPANRERLSTFIDEAKRMESASPQIEEAPIDAVEEVEDLEELEE